MRPKRDYAGLDRLFEPRTVAVAGASAKEGSIGWRTMRFLEDFPGQVCTVGPGMQAETLADVPFAIDQLVINLPTDDVEAVVAEAAAADVASIVLYSGGFADSGDAGRQAQDRLASLCRAAGIRLLGPNSAGMVSVHSSIFSTYSHSIDYARPKAGSIAFVTQSGAVGTFALCSGVERGLGFSRFVATGNEADVDASDCIDWLSDDDETKVILLYLEAVDDGLRLVEAIRKARLAGKPVVVLKGGASETGAAAAASHTGKLAGSDIVFSAAMEAAGACRVASIEEMLDVAYFCCTSRLPGSTELTVLTGSGGIGVMMADAAAGCGLELPPLDEPARAAIRRLIPQAGTLNPVDTTGQILNDFSLLTSVLDVVLSDRPDRTVAIFLATVGVDPRMGPQLVEALRRAKAAHPESVLALCMVASPELRNELEGLGIPVYDEPTRLVQATARAAAFARPPLATSGDEAARPGPPLPAEPWSEDTARGILEGRGIAFPPGGIARAPVEAKEIARRLGCKVALKVISADLPHKSDVGGVMLDVSLDRAAEAYGALLARVAENAPDARIEGVGVAAMLTDGVETFIGAKNDPVFGPVVMFGLGGIHVEVLNDMAVSLAPVSREKAHSMIESIRGAALLGEHRGRSAVDREALADAILAVSRLAAEQRDRVESIEINPFLAREDGGVALDALIVAKAG